MKAARDARAMSQEDVARLLDVVRSTIAMIESGKMVAFEDPQKYERLAEIFPETTATEWQVAAERSRRSYVLSGKMTEEHRRTGDLLAKNWENLSPESLRAIRQTLLHSMATKPPKKNGRSTN